MKKTFIPLASIFTLLLTAAPECAWAKRITVRPAVVTKPPQPACAVPAGAFALRTFADLQGMHARPRTDYVLCNDIDGGGATLAPIGEAYQTHFTGTLDGRHFTIRNIRIVEGRYDSAVSKVQGLFGFLDGAVIQNLKLDNIQLQDSEYYVQRRLGILAGKADHSRVANIDVRNSSIAMLNQGNSYAGGLVGWFENAEEARDLHTENFSITRSTDICDESGNLQSYGGIFGTITRAAGTQRLALNRLSIQRSTFDTCKYSGGLIGAMTGPLDLVDSFATADVSLSTWSYSGGLVGSAADTLILRGHSEANVTGRFNTSGTGASVIGGLAGATARIEDSSASGALSGYQNIGGLVGGVTGHLLRSWSNGSVEGRYDIGGLIGTISIGALVRDCYTTSAVGLALDDSGGLAGSLYWNARVENSYAANVVPIWNPNSSTTGMGLFGSVWRSQQTGEVPVVVNSYYDASLTLRQVWIWHFTTEFQRTTTQMTTMPRAANTYVNWDFENVWAQEAGQYPTLR